MHLYPGYDRLTRTWQRAAIDIAIPDKLDWESDWEWSDYATYLPLEKLIIKLGEALDQLDESWTSVDFKSGTEEDKLRLFSHQRAAETLISKVFTDLSMKYHLPPEEYAAQNFASDDEEAIYRLVKLLKAVHSPDAAQWEKRQSQVHDMASDPRRGEFWNFYSAMQTRYLTQPQQQSPSP